MKKVSELSTNWRMTPNFCSRKIVLCWKFTDVLWRITWLSSTKEHVQKKVDRKMQQHSLWLTIQLKLLKWIERGKVSYSKSSSITKSVVLIMHQISLALVLYISCKRVTLNRIQYTKMKFYLILLKLLLILNL